MDSGRLATSEPVIRLRRVGKRYASAAGETVALRALDLDIEAGEFVSIVGRSGSGKTTLLNLLAGIDTPDEGEVHVGGRRVDELRGAELARWRGRTVGLVFQFFNLLPTLTVAENVMLPLDFARTTPPRARRRLAVDRLDDLGIAEHADKFPHELSGGQQQRAAIARAAVNSPPVLLADEPTGNLDTATGEDVLAQFGRLAASGTTVVMVTHERDVSAHATREVRLEDGAIVDDRQFAGVR
ncbi:ABC transporter ATP-binding protein [Agromyces sp. Soil535]|uniref:ABC transporter ATP-binding protein n=1 Tax=Agromyces sp. Soil535 TaxID=1736390 RepID=UPI0006FC12A7|nr:ABC transporter ATP-binding protein [Agromyces sp. Soil535]KRE29402.1 ABC transporter ATP-binding protein [Agromyces sp. Soil535]